MLSNDNLVRNTGQEKLGTIKHNEPDKYTCYLIAILQQGKSKSHKKMGNVHLIIGHYMIL